MVIISIKKRNQLKLLVEAGRGKAIVLVHPYYDKADARYNSVLENVLRQRKTPVIILEDVRASNKLRKQLSKKEANCIILNTEYHDPALFKKDKIKVNHEQTDLVHFLELIGVKKVFIGGQYATSPTKKFNQPRNWVSKIDSSLGEIYLERLRRIEQVAKYEAKLHERANLPAKKRLNVIIDGCVGVTYRNLISHGVNVAFLPPLLSPDKPPYWHKKKPKIRSPAKYKATFNKASRLYKQRKC